MINYYEYETSPRKEEPDYDLPRRKTVKPKRLVEEEIDIKRKLRREAVAQSKRNAKHIIEIGIGFIILLTISYRYALINSKFSEKENLKAKLAEVQKQNAQLQVSIEQGMNIKNIEQAAGERLGMQKLNTNQKVYVSLPKKDYIESASRTIKEETEENWWQKFIKLLKGEE